MIKLEKRDEVSRLSILFTCKMTTELTFENCFVSKCTSLRRELDTLRKSEKKEREKERERERGRER